MAPLLSLLGATLLCALCATMCIAGKRGEPHPHQGELTPFDNHHIPYVISLEQQAKLDAGEPVVFSERSGSSGRGLVIQDVAAPPALCMNRIRDLDHYHTMVPKVRSVKEFDRVRHANGTEQVSAEFNVGMAFFSFHYFLRLTFEPRYHTLTWTLDYNHKSDFDDTTGHWQVMPHPTKSGWSRILYSTAATLPAWVPEFVVNYLTKAALLEATSWVRKEAERMAKIGVQEASFPALELPDLRPCFLSDGESGRYDTHCVEGAGARAVSGEL